jgi:hypothetical protein
VLCNKSGFVDGPGTRQLGVPYLGMLIAHQVGHSSSPGATRPSANYRIDTTNGIGHGCVA